MNDAIPPVPEHLKSNNEEPDTNGSEDVTVVPEAVAQSVKIDVDGKYDVSYSGSPKTVEQEFTYPTHTDPARQLPKTATYLDDVQREQAEIQRAKIEGREPDLKNPPATQSTPLRPTYVVRAELPGDAAVSVVADKTLPVVIGKRD